MTREVKNIGVVYSRIYSYARYMDAIAEYEERAMHNTRKDDGAEYIRGSYQSDPTARGAVALIDLPPRIRTMQRWVDVIDMAIEKARAEDYVYQRKPGRGSAYAMQAYFCMRGPARDKSRNADMRMTLAKRCGVTPRTIYSWLHMFAESVYTYAEQEGLIKEGKA